MADNMNKNMVILAVVVVGVSLLGLVGYAMWSASNNVEVVDQNQTVTPNPVTPTTTQNGVPVVKTDSQSAPYISTVVVKGTVNPNGLATTYWFEYGQTSSLGTITPNYSIGSGYTTIYTPAYITGLAANTNYYFRLSAKNALGTVNGAVYSFKTNNTPAPDGVAPTTSTMSPSDITRTTVNLRGQINPNSSETTYWFEYGSSAQLGSVTAFQSAGSGKSSSVVSVSLSSLQPLTKYYYRLNAQNQFGTINGQIVSFTTQGPAAASAPTVNTNSASSIDSTSAKVNGSVNPNGLATTYWFEYSTNSLLSNVIVSTTQEQSLSASDSSTGVSAELKNLSKNTKYYIRLVAKNQQGTTVGDMESFTTKK